MYEGIVRYRVPTNLILTKVVAHGAVGEYAACIPDKDLIS